MELGIVTKYNDATKFNNLIEIGSLFLQCFSEQNPDLAKQFGGMILMDFLEKGMAKGNIVSKLEKIYNSTSIRTNLPDMYLGFIGYAVLVMRGTATTETYIKEYIDRLASQPQIMKGESQKIFQICQQYYNKLIKDQAKTVVENNRESIATILGDKLRFDSANQNPELFLETSDFPHGIVDIANQGIMKTHDSLMAGYRIANEGAGKVNQLDFFLSLHRNRNNIAPKKAYQEKIAKLPYFEGGSNKKGLIILENDQVLDIGSPASEKKYPKEFELCFLGEDEEFDWKLLESCMTPYITDMEINGSLLQTSPLQQGTKKYNIKPYLRKNQTPSSSNKDMLLAEVNKYILPEYEDLKEKISQKESTLAPSQLPEYFGFLHDLHAQHIIVSQYTSPESFEIRVILSEYPPSSIIIRVGNGVLNCICIHNGVPIAEYESTKINLDRKNESTFYSGEPKIILSLKEQIRSFLIESKREDPAHNFYGQLSENEKDVFLHKAAIGAFHFLLDTQEIGNERFTRGDLIYNRFYTPTKKRHTSVSDYIQHFEMIPVVYKPENSDVFVRRYLNLNHKCNFDIPSYNKNNSMVFTDTIFTLKQKDIFRILAQQFSTETLDELKKYINVLEETHNQESFINEKKSEEVLLLLEKYQKNSYKTFKIIIANIDIFQSQYITKACKDFLTGWLENLHLQSTEEVIYGAYLQQKISKVSYKKDFKERLKRISNQEFLGCFENGFTKADNIQQALANQEKCHNLIAILHDLSGIGILMSISQFILKEKYNIKNIGVLSIIAEYGVEIDFDLYLARVVFHEIENMGKNIAISGNLYCALRKRFELERSKVQGAYQKVVEMEKEKTSLSTEKKSGSHKKIKIERPDAIIRDIERIQRNIKQKKVQSSKLLGTAKRIQGEISELKYKKMEDLTTEEQNLLQEYPGRIRGKKAYIASIERKIDDLSIIGREKELENARKEYRRQNKELETLTNEMNSMRRFREKDIPDRIKKEIKDKNKRIESIRHERSIILQEIVTLSDQKRELEAAYPVEGNQTLLTISKREAEIQEYQKHYGSSVYMKSQNGIFFDTESERSDCKIDSHIRSFAIKRTKNTTEQKPENYSVTVNYTEIYATMLESVLIYYHILSGSKDTNYTLNTKRLHSVYSYSQTNFITALKCIEYLNTNGSMETQENAQILLETLIDAKEVSIGKIPNENEDFFYFFLSKYGLIGKRVSAHTCITDYLKDKLNRFEIEKFVTQYKIKNIRRLETKTSP